MMSFDNLMQIVRDAANGGINSMSTGEALSAALVLNRVDWLQAMNYTIAEAIDRIDESTIPLLRQAERTWHAEHGAMQHVQQIERTAAATVSTLEPVADETEVGLAAELVTYSEAPGYRDADLYFDVQQIGARGSEKKHRIRLKIRLEDAHSIVSHLINVHRFAWSGDGPIDKKDGETRPTWIDARV